MVFVGHAEDQCNSSVFPATEQFRRIPAKQAATTVFTRRHRVYRYHDPSFVAREPTSARHPAYVKHWLVILVHCDRNVVHGGLARPQLPAIVFGGHRPLEYRLE
jgi:hypothetical protein